MKNIKKLDRAVIGRIAAGETIHYPFNVVKELMENSLDAGATLIRIHAVSGGLELIRVIDNGHGIAEQDLQLVCERNATSKIESYQDLDQLVTFGFRGEAMASIANVSKVTITSKDPASKQIFQIGYQHGQLVGWPKKLRDERLVGWLDPLRTEGGTAITIQNLFQNTVLRKKALKETEESQKILDCVQKYAIHHVNIAFSLTQDSSLNGFHSKAHAITSEQEWRENMTRRVEEIYGYQRQTINTVGEKGERWTFKACYSNTGRRKGTKANVFILFVNDRLVENAKIKREVKKVLMSAEKDTTQSMFVYIDIHVHPRHVDVNIHPTKNQVRLLEEDKIIDALTNQLYRGMQLESVSVVPSSRRTRKSKLGPISASQRTLDQYFKPSKLSSSSSDSDESTLSQPATPATPTHGSVVQPSIGSAISLDDSFRKRLQSLKMPVVGNQTIQSPNLSHQTSLELQGTDLNAISGNSITRKARFTPASDVAAPVSRKRIRLSNAKKTVNSPFESRQDAFIQKEVAEEEGQGPENLESIQLLQNEINQSEDRELSKAISYHKCIGMIDDVLLLACHKDIYYLFQYQAISVDYIYQRIVYQFPQFGRLEFSTPINITHYLSYCMEYDPAELSGINIQIILEHAKLLSEYFKTEFEVKEGQLYLKSLPAIVLNYVPSSLLQRLPLFLLDLSTQIDWKDEMACLQGLAETYARLYYCCHEGDWNSVANSMRHHQSIKAHSYLIERGYVSKMDIKKEML